jgi:hypothetical protein
MSPINIMVSARGEVSERAREQAREKVGELESVLPGSGLALQHGFAEDGANDSRAHAGEQEQRLVSRV